MADFDIIGKVSLEPGSLSATERQLLKYRNIPINFKVDNSALGKISSDVKEFDRSLQAAASRVTAFVSTTSIFYGVARASTEMIRSFISVEASLKSIQVILSPTVSQFKNFSGALFDIARDTGKGFDEVAEAALNLSRQGLKMQEVLQRTSDALKLSRQSGLDVTDSTNALTAAINTFNKEILTSTDIINKLANVDTKFAVSQRDSIEAIKRAGAAAQDAGVGFKQLVAFTAELQQTTARGGAVIGNALKSIFTRVERSSTLDALEQFNVKTRDLQGNVLSADKILQNLANTYKTLSKTEQVAVTERVAGIQQINQLKSLLNDLASSNSIYGRALAAASQQTNTAIERNKLLNQTLQAQLNITKQNAVEASSVVGKAVFQPIIKRGADIADFLTGGIKQTSDEGKSTGQKIGEGVLKGLGEALSGPGLIVGASVLINIFKGLSKYTSGVLLDYANFSRQSKEQANIQGSINQILQSGNAQYRNRLAAAKSVHEEEAAILSIMTEINGLQVRNGSISYQAAGNLAAQGVSVNKAGNNFNIPRAAAGYFPVDQEQKDIKRGVGGASSSARAKIIPDFNFGGGKRGSVVANTDEYLVPHFAGGEGSAIFNKQMAAKFGLPRGAQKINEAAGFLPSIVHEPSKIAGGLTRSTLTGHTTHVAAGLVPSFANPFDLIGQGSQSNVFDVGFGLVAKQLREKRLGEIDPHALYGKQTFLNTAAGLKYADELVRKHNLPFHVAPPIHRSKIPGNILQGVSDRLGPNVFFQKLIKNNGKGAFPTSYLERTLTKHVEKNNPYGITNFTDLAPRNLVGNTIVDLLTNYSGGHIPSFFNKYSGDEKNYNGALIDKNFQYIYSPKDELTLEERLVGRKKGFEIVSGPDVELIHGNKDILKGHKLNIVDPTSYRATQHNDFLTEFGEQESILNILSAKSAQTNKLEEAQLSKFLQQSVPLDEFIKKNKVGNSLPKLLSAAKSKFGDYFVKNRFGFQGKGVYSRGVLEQSSEIPDPKTHFLQKEIPNTSGREFRVSIGGVKNRGQLLGPALIRGQDGRTVNEFISEKFEKQNDFKLKEFGKILYKGVNRVGYKGFSAIGEESRNIGSYLRPRISNFLSHRIAESQGRRAFNSLPNEIKNGSIAGLDVLETGNHGLKKAGQYLSELVGLPKLFKGGGVAEFNLSQNLEDSEIYNGQSGAGFTGSLYRADVLTAAAKALIKNNGGNFAGGYAPNFQNPLMSAIKREHAAGIPYSQIKVEKSAELINNLNPAGLAVTNQRDEPGGISQGIRRARREGVNPKTYGAAGGLIPSFADLNITPGQLGQFGSANSSNLIGKNAKDAIQQFTKSLALKKEDLAGPIDQLKRTVISAVTDALKLDPRQLTQSQQQGANRIFELFRKNNRGNLKAAHFDVQEDIRQSGQVEKLLTEFAKDVPAQNKSLLFGGRRVKKLSSELYGSSGFGSLSIDNQNLVRHQVGNITAEQADRRGQKLQSAGILASFAAPVLTNAATGLFGNDGKQSRQANAIGSAVGDGVSAAAVLGFSPAGIAIGAVTAGFVGLKGALDASRKSLDDYSKEIEDTKGRFEQNKNSISGGFQGQEQLKDIVARGGSRSEINQVSQQIQDAIRNIDDPNLRNRFVNARTDDQKRDLLTSVSADEVKATSQKGLQAELEQIVSKSRVAGFNKSNLSLNDTQRNDLGGFIANSLPLSQKGGVRGVQIAGLEALGKGNSNLDDLQKVLGNLKVDSETLNKFKQLSLIEQEALTKNVIERQLSAAAIEKETNNLKTFASSLLNINRTLERLTTAKSFQFQSQNIVGEGTRQRAISGASQAAGALGEFFSPETRNREENRIKGFELENERISNITKISTDFADNLKNLPTTVQDAFKKFESDAEPGDKSSSRSNEFQSQARQLILETLGSSNNPIDAANTANDKFKQFESGLQGKGAPELVKALEDFRNSQLNIPIQLEQQRAAERQALRENTNKLAELTISLNKKTNFFGGGNFESTNNLDVSKITAGLQTGQSLRGALTSPFQNRLLRSRGSSFSDFFQGRQIDVAAETGRTNNVISSVAAGRLQALQLGLFDGNPRAINETRGLVSQAEQSSIFNKGNVLLRSAQNSGDTNFVDILRQKLTPENVKETADLRALKQVPLDDKTRAGLEGKLDQIDRLLENKNLPADLQKQLQGGRRDVQNQLGPDGVFRELNSQLTELNSNFKTGIQGDFDKLTKSADSATSALTDLSKVAGLLAQATKEQAANTKIINSQNKLGGLEEQLQNLKNKDTARIDPKTKILDDLFNQNKPENGGSLFDRKNFGRSVYGNSDIGRLDRIDRDSFGGALSTKYGAKTVQRVADTEEKYFSGQLSGSDFGKQYQNLLPDDATRREFARERFRSKVQKESIFGAPISDKEKDSQADQFSYLVGKFGGKDQKSESSAAAQKVLQELIKAEQQKINEAGASVNQSRGHIPTFGSGFLSSLNKEKRDIFRGIGGAMPGDSAYVTNVAGIGPAVVNTGESIIKNFAGTGKDAILNRRMKKRLGGNFADGEIPNIDAGNLNEKTFSYGQTLVANDDLSKIVAAYKSGGVEAMKVAIEKQNNPNKNQNLIANKADGFDPSGADFIDYDYSPAAYGVKLAKENLNNKNQHNGTRPGYFPGYEIEGQRQKVKTAEDYLNASKVLSNYNSAEKNNIPLATALGKAATNDFKDNFGSSSRRNNKFDLGKSVLSDLTSRTYQSNKYGTGYVTGLQKSPSTSFDKISRFTGTSGFGPKFGSDSTSNFKFQEETPNEDFDLLKANKKLRDGIRNGRTGVDKFLNNPDSIFGNNAATKRNSEFKNQFSAESNDEFRNGFQERVNREARSLDGFNKTGLAGGFKNVSLQGASGLDRPNNLRPRNAEENEAFARRNPAQNQRFNTATNNNFAKNDTANQNLDKLINTVQQLVDSQKKNAPENTPGGKPAEQAVTVNQKIQVEVNGNITVNNDKVQQIVKEEIDKANQNIKARISALETSNKTGQPLQAVPPTVTQQSPISTPAPT